MLSIWKKGRNHLPKQILEIWHMITVSEISYREVTKFLSMRHFFQLNWKWTCKNFKLHLIFHSLSFLRVCVPNLKSLSPIEVRKYLCRALPHTFMVYIPLDMGLPYETRDHYLVLRLLQIADSNKAYRNSIHWQRYNMDKKFAACKI